MKNGCNSKPMSHTSEGVRGDSTAMGMSNKSTKPGYDLGKSVENSGSLSKGYSPMGKIDAGSDGMKPD